MSTIDNISRIISAKEDAKNQERSRCQAVGANHFQIIHVALHKKYLEKIVQCI